MYNKEKIKELAKKMEEIDKKYNLPTWPNKKKEKDKE